MDDETDVIHDALMRRAAAMKKAIDEEILEKLRNNKMDRFDFEQQIMKCWNVTDDIGELSEAIMERDMSTDQVVNVLNGMQELYQIKFEKLFNIFEQILKEKKIA